METLFVISGAVGFVGLIVFGLGFRDPVLGFVCFTWVPLLPVTFLIWLLSGLNGGDVPDVIRHPGDDRPLLRWIGGTIALLGYGSLGFLWLLEPSLF